MFRNCFIFFAVYSQLQQILIALLSTNNRKCGKYRRISTCSPWPRWLSVKVGRSRDVVPRSFNFVMYLCGTMGQKQWKAYDIWQVTRKTPRCDVWWMIRSRLPCSLIYSIYSGLALNLALSWSKQVDHAWKLKQLPIRSGTTSKIASLRNWNRDERNSQCTLVYIWGFLGESRGVGRIFLYWGVRSSEQNTRLTTMQ